MANNTLCTHLCTYMKQKTSAANWKFPINLMTLKSNLNKYKNTDS